MFKRLKYWWFRRNNGYPCQQEVKELVSKTRLRSLRTLGMAMHYCMSPDIETTAREFNVTRERVRQVLLKLYWSVRDKDKIYPDLDC